MADWQFVVIALAKNRQYTKVREIIVGNIYPAEIDDVYRWMYEHLELWGDTPDQQDKAILVIRDAIVNHTLVADPEINLSACIIELIQDIK